MLSVEVDGIAKAFAQHYYDTFKANRRNLAGLYQNESILSWEGRPHVGQPAIIQHLVSLPFTKVEHKLVTIDAQPSQGGGVVVFITGQLIVDDGKPWNFSQVFNLANVGGSYVVSNDMFRLNYT